MLDKESVDYIGIIFNGMQIDIVIDISIIGMQLLWMVLMSIMLLEFMQNIFLLLLFNIGLLVLVLFGFIIFCYYKGCSYLFGVGFFFVVNSELCLLCVINEEIVFLLLLGLFVYDQEVN